MKVILFILLLGLIEAKSTYLGDCIWDADGSTRVYTTANTDTGAAAIDDTVTDFWDSSYTTIYALTLDENEYCSHWSAYRFKVAINVDTANSDSSSSYSATYYEMVYNARYQCIPDPLSELGTLSYDTEYTTQYDGGTSVDPCGYYVLLDWTGDASGGAQGYFYYYTDGATMLAGALLAAMSSILIY